MNESIITSRKVKWPPNRTEADQGSKREGVYTTLDSEQFVWTYYYQMHPLGGAGSESNKLCAMGDEHFVLRVSFIAHQSAAASLCRKSAYSTTTVVLRSVTKDVLYNTLYCSCVHVGNFIFQNRCEPQYIKIFT
jgi:hypothetical protein